MKSPRTASCWLKPWAEQEKTPPKTSPRAWPERRRPSLAPRAALTLHRGGQGGDARLRVAEVHLLVQAAQRVEGGVCVLLHEQVPGIDLVDHDHLHGDAVREHELQTGEGQCVQRPFTHLG